MSSALARIRRRLRSQAGFGMIELAIAMGLLAVGLLAVYGLFASSLVSIRRAAITTTAAALADSELEGYRGVTYDAIVLPSASVTTAAAPYTSDSAYGAPGTSAGQSATCSTGGCTTNVPSKTVAGADGKSYRVDTYVTWRSTQSQTTPTPTTGRLVKRVTIVVRDVTTPSSEYARVSSAFDQASGL